MTALNTPQTVALAVYLSALALALCTAVAVQIHRAGDWRRGRHSAPPTTPTPPQSPVPPAFDGGGRRRLADDWREQVELPPDPVLVRPYVAHLGGVR